MVSIRYANAMAETLHYLKGVREEDINRIPKKFKKFLEENASKDYVCEFDYTKPLNELKLLDETRGIIGTICLNYWCNTKEEKELFLNKIHDNEVKYQQELREKYNPDNIFKSTKNQEINSTEKVEEKNQNPLMEYKPSFFQRIIEKIKNIFKK